MNDHAHWTMMRQAIDLSRQGFTAPNPHVGCVIVRDGVVVGTGFHDHAGGAHAEVVALQAAGEAARGADVYVTLEPCVHHGRTPPCTEALIAAGVRRVFVAVADPNPRAGGGVQVLREAGIEVEVGQCGEEAAAANEPFLFAHREARPFVAVKAAITLDGYLARPDGTSQWITGPGAREEGHRLRARMGAVCVGRATVEQDNPALTARVPGVVNQPLRVILDPTAMLPRTATVFADENHWHVTGSVDLHAILAGLRERGHIGLLVEGGGHTIGSFLRADLVDRIHLFVAPTLFLEGRTWTGTGPAVDITERFKLRRTHSWGPDIELVYERLNGQ